MTCGAFARDDGLVLNFRPVCYACLIVTPETKFGHIELQQFFAVVRAVRIMAEHAETGGSGKMNVLLGCNFFIVALIAEIRHGSRQQFHIVGRMRIVAGRTFARA